MACHQINQTASLITDALTLPANWCVFGCKGCLSLLNQLTTNLTPECSCGSTLQILFISLQQLLTPLKSALFFLATCQQTSYPLRTEISHTQIQVPNMIYTHYKFMIILTDFVDFVFVSVRATIGRLARSASLVSVRPSLNAADCL